MASKVSTQSGIMYLWLQLIPGKNQEWKQDGFVIRSSTGTCRENRLLVLAFSSKPISPPSFSRSLYPANQEQWT